MVDGAQAKLQALTLSSARFEPGFWSPRQTRSGVVRWHLSATGRDQYAVAARRQDVIIGRIDDVVNVSGHRLLTAEVESAIVAHDSMAEAAVISQHDEDIGQAMCAFVTLQGGTPVGQGHTPVAAQHCGGPALGDVTTLRGPSVMAALTTRISVGR